MINNNISSAAPSGGTTGGAVNMPCSDLLNISLSLDKSILSGSPELVNEIYLMNKGMNQCLGTLKFSLTLQPVSVATTPNGCATTNSSSPVTSTPSTTSSAAHTPEKQHHKLPNTRRPSVHGHESNGSTNVSNEHPSSTVTTTTISVGSGGTTGTGMNTGVAERSFSSTAQTQDGNLPLRKRSALRPPPTPVSPLTSISPEQHNSSLVNSQSAGILPSQQEDSCKRRRKISIFERRPSVVNGMHPTQSDIALGQPCAGLSSPSSNSGAFNTSADLKDDSALHASHDLKRKCSLFNNSEFSPECLENDPSRKISAVSLSGISFNPDDEFDSLDEMDHADDKKSSCAGIRRHAESDPETHGHIKIKEEPNQSSTSRKCSQVSPGLKADAGHHLTATHHGVAGPPLVPPENLTDLEKNYQQLHGGPHRHPGSFYHPPPLLHVSQMSLPAAAASACSPCSVTSNRSTPPDLAAAVAAANSAIPPPPPPHSQTVSHRRHPPVATGGAGSGGLNTSSGRPTNAYYSQNSPIAPLGNSYRTLNSASSSGSSRMATCDLCPYQAKHPYQIKLHKRNCHSDERPYQCNFCWYASKQRCNLNRHVRQVHRNASSSLSGNSSASVSATNIPSGSSAASNVPAGALMGVPLPRASGYFGLPLGSGRNPAGGPPSHGVFHLTKR